MESLRNEIQDDLGLDPGAWHIILSCECHGYPWLMATGGAGTANGTSNRLSDLMRSETQSYLDLETKFGSQGTA